MLILTLFSYSLSVSILLFRIPIISSFEICRFDLLNLMCPHSPYYFTQALLIVFSVVIILLA